MSATLFFDLDGTLTDPFEGITGSVRYALERLGAPVPEASDLAWCIGPPLADTFARLLPDDRVPEAIDLYRERFGSVGLFENTPYPGIHETLDALRGAGFELCVASSKPHVYVRRILDRFELSPFFGAVFGSELDGTRTDKADLLRFALAETGCAPRDATMIGDRRHDIVGAIANEVGHVGVLYGYGSAEELREAGAERLAREPTELIRLFV
jgi:phosphoglycolate phosphatase